MTTPGQHWDHVYEGKDHELVSWKEPDPSHSLALIESCDADRDEPVVPLRSVHTDDDRRPRAAETLR